MDTGSDFITPEFLNVLFFQQKNLVIYPYVDIKHLQALEIFTVGHNLIPLESTALNNLKEIIEAESYDLYSNTPNLYLIYNLTKSKTIELLTVKNIRFILNAKDYIGDLANGSMFVFYNKKTKRFLNHSFDNLEFERELINTSINETILQDKIQKIKLISSQIFTEIAQSGTIENISQILTEYDQIFWKKILDFTRLYNNISIPDASEIIKKRPTGKTYRKKESVDFSDEYELIKSSHRHIAEEFIRVLHDYRSNRVNSSNLELEELYNPQKLYNYLRNHHWKDGIDSKFAQEWVKMKQTKYELLEDDTLVFKKLLVKLNVSKEVIQNLDSENKKSGEFNREINMKKSIIKKSDNFIPDVRDFPNFKKWVLTKLKDIENLLL